MKVRGFAVSAALVGGSAVALGAFASHAMTGEAASTMDIAVRYAMWHALAILACLAIDRQMSRAPLLFLAGILLFSGSLAAFALGGPRFLVFVTPVGGVVLILGWLTAALSFWRLP
ncbi:MAG: DUF423 domain-containing protein [Geminicoccaceae bacterium]|nr:DUF423 domain-containing protein [Geminicoccaceae bacterium]